MLLSEQKLVEEVIHYMILIEGLFPDDLDKEEMIRELRDRFGVQTVRWAIESLAARRIAQGSRSASVEKDPMWDRDLDG